MRRMMRASLPIFARLDAAKQMCSAALNRSNDVRNCRLHYRNIRNYLADLTGFGQKILSQRCQC
jgi:hypothetical protein